MTDFDACWQYIIDHINDGRYAPQNYLDETRHKLQTQVDQIRQAGVDSVAALYALIDNEQADIPLRRTAIALLHPLVFYSPSKMIDRRRALSPLLRAVHSTDEGLRADAIWALGTIANKRAFKFLAAIVQNSSPGQIRTNAVHSLSMLHDPRASAILAVVVADRTYEPLERIYAIQSLSSYPQLPDLLWQIILDPTDNLDVRCVAIQWLGIRNNELAQVYNRLLQDENVYIRFWAAYGWAQTFDIDTSAALPILDNLVAFDHTPEPTMWHVSREAMRGFEMAWHSQLTSNPDHTYYGTMYLISPLLEFYDYQRKIYYWDQAQSHMISTPFEQTTSLNIDAAWLTEQIRSQWPAAKFNVRQPQPECLRLDWQIDMPSRMLIGGLHREGYLIMLTCDDEDAAAFGVWLRGIITPEHILRFYQWADYGVIIQPDMTPAQLAESSEKAAYDAFNPG